MTSEPSYAPAESSLPLEKIEIDALFLANSVEIREGLLFVLGGAWSRCWPPDGAFPFTYPLNVAAIFRIPYHDTNTDHPFEISVRDADERELARAAGAFKVGREADLTQGMSQLIALGGTTPVKLEAPGIYHISLVVDGVEAKRIAFEVLQRQPARR